MNPVWSYDLIASIYATDMGLSMPFDDVACYRRITEQHPGPVLELGCGSGRILIELLRAGLDVTGIDRSLPMLQQAKQDAMAKGLLAQLAQMDLRALALHGQFNVILAPYSLITYLTEPADLESFMREVSAALVPNGVLVLDAFIPRDMRYFDDFREDYVRPHGTGQLQRAKRVARNSDGTNRIERRYRLLDAAGVQVREILTCETIRPQNPAALRALVQRHALRPVGEYFDYAFGSENESARFYTLLAQR